MPMLSRKHRLSALRNARWASATPDRPTWPISAIYDLTGIYTLGYISSVESSFAIVAEPNRRAILSLLLSSERSVGEIERELRLSQPSVSKHLRVLRDAGFVRSRIEAQRRLYRLRPEPLMELDAWLVPFRRFWSKHVDALEQHLDKLDKLEKKMKKVSSVKGKQKP
jgi:DNA-binding transcriptional ArsR family regulator